MPETIANYRLLAPLGESRAGIVYRALSPDGRQPVALKLVPAERFHHPKARQKFLEEARAAATLSHPHLRQLYEVGETGDSLYLAMEYLEGSTLRSLLVGGGLELETALAWAAEIAEALSEAHAQHVVHGGLTAASVFITQQGTVKVLDTGLWRLAPNYAGPAAVDLSHEARLQETQLRSAEVAALAPEQIRGGEPEARSDIFALGALLYEMTTGRNPFVGRDAVQTMHLVLNRTPPPVSARAPQAPAALDRGLARALEKKPEARFQAAGELAAALHAVAAGEALPYEEAAPKPAVRVRMTKPVWVGLGVGVALLVAWILYWVLLRP